MKHLFFLSMMACLLLGCASNDDSGKQYLLQGAWTLRQMEHPIGHTRTFTEEEGTLLSLYDGDSVMYQCWLTRTGTGLLVKPVRQVRIVLVDKGHGECVYLEDDDPHPLTLVSDTTMIIQQNGVLGTWHRADDIMAQWGAEIKDIVVANKNADSEPETQVYMLSAKERRQANIIQWLLAASVILVVLALSIVIVGHRRRQQLMLQLQQIQEVKDERPQAVRQAIESVETTYFVSDEYLNLQRRIATGQRLKDEDWQGIESQLRKIYPGFGSQLRSLYAMSELEYQVCLLIKLRIAPSDIAAVLTRDASTISTVRSRLYKKVFNRKGGAKEWDEFILSIKG